MMTPDELREELEKFEFWYHKIDLGGGVVTPGLDFEPVWDMVRQTRNYLDYTGKRVLDLASFDGMWAFEAEGLGAETVIAVDSYYRSYKNFLFCKRVLDSNVIPYYNVPPHEIANRLDVYLQEDFEGDLNPQDRLFHIVQHLGLLYHARDPLLTLAQSRSVIRTGGYILLETAAAVDEHGSFMVFNGTPPNEADRRGRIYSDVTTWWAPTLPCLKEMLRACMFEPIEETVHVLRSDVAKETAEKIRVRFRRRFSADVPFRISRVCIIAKAIGAKDVTDEYFEELARTYRNPFLVIDHLRES